MTGIVRRYRGSARVALCGVLAYALPLGAGQTAAHRLAPDEIIVTAQDYQPVPSFLATSNSVEVKVRVLGADGTPVATLRQNDFTIEDNGKPQVIASFAGFAHAETATVPLASAVQPCAPLKVPRTSLLYFDDFDTSALDLAYAREKVLAYLDRTQCAGALSMGEAIGIATGSGIGDLNFTADYESLRRALLRISPHPRSSVSSLCPLITPSQAWEIINAGIGSGAERLAIAQAQKCRAPFSRNCDTYIHDLAEQVWGEAEIQTHAILADMRNGIAALSRQSGTRNLVLTSSGFLTQELAMQQAQQAVIDAALRAQVVIDALDARGLTAPNQGGGQWNDPWIDDPTLSFWRLAHDSGGFSLADSAMWEMAESTGGDFLHDNNDLQAAYQRDSAVPDSYYALSFTPAVLRPDGNFHRLKIHVTAPGHFQIAARYGYFAPTAEQAGLTPETQRKIASEVLGTDRQTGIDFSLHAARGDHGVHLDVRLDPNTIHLEHKEGRHSDRLVIVVALLTPDGHFISGRSFDLGLRLTGASLKDVSRNGVGVPVGLELAAVPGTYRLRAVVYEASSRAEGAISATLTVAAP